MSETVEKIDKQSGGSGDWYFYESFASTTAEHSLPSDFKAISVFITKTNNLDHGARLEASRAEIDKVIDSRAQNGQYIQYGYESSVAFYLNVKKSGDSYTYGAARNTNGTWGDSSYTTYVFLK